MIYDSIQCHILCPPKLEILVKTYDSCVFVCVCVVLDDSDTLSRVFVLFVQDDRPLLDFLQLLVP